MDERIEKTLERYEAVAESIGPQLTEALRELAVDAAARFPGRVEAVSMYMGQVEFLAPEGASPLGPDDVGEFFDRVDGLRDAFFAFRRGQVGTAFHASADDPEPSTNPFRDHIHVDDDLWDLYRMVTHPHGVDGDALLDRVRARLAAAGRDPDDWSELDRGPRR